MSSTSSCGQCRAVARQSVFAAVVFGISISCGCAPSGSRPGNVTSATPPAAPEVKWGEPVDGLQTRLTVDFIDGVAYPLFHIDVRNVSDQPIQMGEVTGGTPLRLIGQGGDALDGFWGLMSALPRSYENLLPPGKQMVFGSASLAIHFDRKDPIPGTYTLQWGSVPVSHAWNGRVPPPSNTARFTIKPMPPKRSVKWLDSHAWSKVPGSLQARLTAPARKFASGKPIPIRLELCNVGGEPVRYHNGATYIVGGIQVIGPDGRELPWKAPASIRSYAWMLDMALGLVDVRELGLEGPVWTVGSTGPPIPPDKRVKLDEFNLASSYHMRKPGRYKVKYRGHAGHGDGAPSMPPSPTFEIEVGADRISQTDGDPVGKILSALPDDWKFSGTMQRTRTFRSSPGFGWSRVRGTGSIALVHKSYDHRSIPPDTVAPVYLWLTRERAVPVAIHARRWGLPVEYASTEYLGGNNYYHVYLHVPESAAKVWPTITADLRRALRVLEKP
jgi:hypothetical protein